VDIGETGPGSWPAYPRLSGDEIANREVVVVDNRLLVDLGELDLLMADAMTSAIDLCAA